MTTICKINERINVRAFCHFSFPYLEEMSDWFNDPFFTDTPQPGPDMFKDMHESFRQIDRQMNNLMQAAFSTLGIGFEESDRRKGQQGKLGYSQRRTPPKVEELDSTRDYQKASKQPRIEEPSTQTFHNTGSRRNYNSTETMSPATRTRNTERDFSSSQPKDQKPYMYCSVQSGYYNSDGTQHLRRKDFDSTGKTHMGEMRKLGDQSIYYDRKIDTDGKPVDSMQKHGIADNEVDSFNKKWEERKKNDYFLNYDKKFGQSHNKGLGYSGNKSNSLK